MIPGFVDGLEIRSVSQLDDTDSENKYDPKAILFYIKDQSYYLFVARTSETEKYYPRTVFHLGHLLNSECQFCGNEMKFNTECYEFRDYLDELFQRLISFNSIRLKWLFLPHEESE